MKLRENPQRTLTKKLLNINKRNKTKIYREEQRKVEKEER